MDVAISNSYTKDISQQFLPYFDKNVKKCLHFMIGTLFGDIFFSFNAVNIHVFSWEMSSISNLWNLILDEYEGPI